MPEELTRALNRLAGITDPLKQKGAAGAASLWATGQIGMELVGALNVKIGRPADGSALELNGALQRLGLAGADRNAALETVVNVLRLPGVSGNYVSTPDSAALSVTGDIDLRVKVAADRAPAGRAMQFLTKWISGVGNLSWMFYYGASGVLSLGFSIDGTASEFRNSTVVAPITERIPIWVRVTRASGTGTIQFFTSSDGNTWTQLGSNVASTVGGFFDSGTAVTVGAQANGSESFEGTIYYASVRNGIGGTIVGEFDATKAAVRGLRSPTTYADAYNNTWTINGADWWWSTPTLASVANAIHLDPQYVKFPGTSGNYASTPDTAALSITGDIDVRIKVALDDWTPSGFQFLMAKTTSATQCSWSLGVNSNGSLGVMVCPDGASANRVFSGSVIPGFVDGSVHWIRFTWVDATNAYTTYHSDDGVAWTTIQTGTLTSAGIFDGTAAVTVGGQDGGGSTLAGKVYYAEIRNGIGGAIVGHFTPHIAAVTAVRTPTTFSSPTGETWTLNGSAWEWSPTSDPKISTPDSAALSITGDIDLRAKVTLDDWLTIPRQQFLGKWTTNSGYLFRTSGANPRLLELTWGDGTATITKTSTADIPFAAGETGWVRVTLDVDNGAVGNDVKFYTSTDGVTWVQLGSTVTTALPTLIGDNANALEIGSALNGERTAMGTIHYAEVRNGIGGTVVGVFNPQSVRVTGSATPTTFTSPTGQVWSVSGSGWRWTGQP